MPMTQAPDAPDRDWWRGAVIYQIYPRSFQDSNGDGIGDLKGIIARLGHVAELGADAIWISPFFTSPMKDYGYDVSDYRDVDPIFGALSDFDALIAEAHRLGLRVMVDLVISHTSDRHPWFRESRLGRDGPRADWYVWADPKPDGTAPNNWLSQFGGSAWSWDPARMQYYLHNFLAAQPDLNLHHPEVQDALLDIARYWLDRGVDGFRLDTVNYYFHDPLLRDNPALPPEERNDTTAPAVNPYNFQQHLYDKTRPENLAFLRRFRALLDEYPAATAVGEVGDGQRGLEIAGEYTSGGDKMHMCYAFEFLAPDMPDAARIRAVVEHFGAVAPDGWACWAFSNHDVVRHVTRWGALVADRPALARVLASVLLSLRGSVCLYQGEELGLTEADIAFDDLHDPYGKEFWPEYKGRDGCRTPMAWEADSRNAGFSDAQKLWLPMPVEHRLAAVSTQRGVEGSVLEHYRRFLAFRRRHPALVKGEIEFLDAGAALGFIRSDGGERVLCLYNLTAEPLRLPAPEGDWHLLTGHGLEGGFDGGMADLPPWGGLIAAGY